MSFGEGNLRERVDKLRAFNGELCAEVNEKDRRIEKLERACCALMMLVEQANNEDGVTTEDANNAWALMESLGLDERYRAPWLPMEGGE